MVSFLDGLPDVARTELLRLGTRRPLQPGHVLFREGAPDNHVELIEQGFLKVTAGVNGREWLLAIRMRGDLLGEYAATTGEPRSATVTTCGLVLSRAIRRHEFLRFLRQWPDAAAQLTATISERLRWANSRRMDVAAFPVQIRLARVLAEVADRCGRTTGGGTLIDIELTHTELAAMIGSAEDTVQRALRTLRTEDLVRTGYRTITVLDTRRLRRYITRHNDE